MIAAALARGTSSLTNVLESEDLERTMSILVQTSAEIRRNGPGAYTVSGMAQGPQARGPQGTQPDKGSATVADPLLVDVGESGTTCRLLTAVLAAGQGLFRIQGRGKMHSRPIASLVQALLGQGAQITYLEQPGCPPLLLRATGLAGGETAIDLDESSQYLSGLLLAAPLARRALSITLAGQKVVSWPYVGLTLQVMEDFGAVFHVQSLGASGWTDVSWRSLGEVIPGRLRVIVQPGAYHPQDTSVEGDWSNASYFLAAGALALVPVGVSGLRQDSLQGDRAIVDILQSMGAKVQWQEGMLLVHGGNLHGLDLDMGHCPDLVPTVAAVAAQARGTTTIRNVAHLRIKESDRLDAVATELRRIGAEITILADGMLIEPAPLPKGRRLAFRTYGDHRLAMSLSLLELGGVNLDLDQPECVAKSFPEFWTCWKALQNGLAGR
jgi:3-phosphoshikimate 1-carboxyvinyltransferase